jgi:hypothetical protein
LQPFNLDRISVYCDFPLRVESLKNNLTETTFSNGETLVTGSRKSRLTNLSTGESLVLNESGTVRTDAAQTTDTLHGRIAVYEFPSEPLGPGVWLLVGQSVATHATPGSFFYSNLTTTGTRIDLCAALS